jgi:hypothetical protein
VESDKRRNNGDKSQMSTQRFAEKSRESERSLAVQKKSDFGQTAQAKSKKPDWNSRSALNQ